MHSEPAESWVWGPGQHNDITLLRALFVPSLTYNGMHANFMIKLTVHAAIIITDG